MDYLVPTEFFSFTLRKEGKYHLGFLIKSNMWRAGRRLQIYDIAAILLSLWKGQKHSLFVESRLCMAEECVAHLHAYCSWRNIWFPETSLFERLGFSPCLIKPHFCICFWRPYYNKGWHLESPRESLPVKEIWS